MSIFSPCPVCGERIPPYRGISMKLGNVEEFFVCSAGCEDAIDFGLIKIEADYRDALHKAGEAFVAAFAAANTRRVDARAALAKRYGLRVET
jgi:hypothetical protein